jgi:TM2 domain-containing membrane protein YozV
MASASFGRRGLAADVVGQPAPRRRRFGQAGIAPPAPSDPVAERRAAFLAAERARAADVEESDAGQISPAVVGKPPILVGGKSLGTAYVLWFFLGGFSAHRFYLGSPLTAIAQIFLWYVSLMFYMAGHSGGGYLVVAGWLWIIGDGAFIPKLRDAANERIRRRAEQLAEPINS